MDQKICGSHSAFCKWLPNEKPLQVVFSLVQQTIEKTTRSGISFGSQLQNAECEPQIFWSIGKDCTDWKTQEVLHFPEEEIYRTIISSVIATAITVPCKAVLFW